MGAVREVTCMLPDPQEAPKSQDSLSPDMVRRTHTQIRTRTHGAKVLLSRAYYPPCNQSHGYTNTLTRTEYTSRMYSTYYLNRAWSE